MLYFGGPAQSFKGREFLFYGTYNGITVASKSVGQPSVNFEGPPSVNFEGPHTILRAIGPGACLIL